MPQKSLTSCSALTLIGVTTVGIAWGVYVGFFSQRSSRCFFSSLKQKLGFSAPPTVALASASEWTGFEVVDNTQITHNTHLITFKLPPSTSKLGLTMASCLMVRMKTSTGDYVSRPYTPIISEEEISKTGLFSLLVKEYPQGTLSRRICNISKGEFVEMKGPIPKINLEDKNSKGEISSLAGVKRLAMIAGGTGITPMLQAADYILRSCSQPKTLIISANDTRDDMLAAKQLDELAKRYPDQVEVQHVLRQDELEGTIKGLVTPAVLQKLSVVPQETQKVFVCGPPPMLTYICGQKAKDKSQGPLSGILRDLGYTEDQVYKF